ncbi:MAG: DNA polymerase III subunit delta' [Pseudomonadota bacterium]|nr:DNA polymerase III subunit delta' [Pseudomonadota bacterium]
MSTTPPRDDPAWQEWMRLPWQQAAWTRLRPDTGAAHHALLLRGPQGTGKARLARALAAALLCQAPAADASACGRCPSCEWLLAGNHPDFRRLTSAALLQQEGQDGAEEGDGEASSERKASLQITIEQVRSLAGFLALTTHRGGARVLLIEPAEAMNAAAANALLKTLEEPPPATRFILLSHQPRRLAPTILSRCLPVDLPLPAREPALQWLATQGITDADAALTQAAGRPLLALTLHDPDALAEREGFLRLLGQPGFDPHAVADKAARESVAAWTDWLQTWCHDLMVARAGGEPRFHPAHRAVLKVLAARADPGRLLDWELRLRSARYESRQPVNARLFCDELLLHYRDLFRA